MTDDVDKADSWLLCAGLLVACPVFLAGGLTPDNVRETVQTAPAYGVDVCSGVRTNGKLDKDKSGNFIAAAQSAWRTGAGS